MFCRPNKVLPAVIHPTKCCVNQTYSNNVVPHIHPTHVTNIHHENFDHVHYNTCSQSNVNEVTHQNYYGGNLPPTGGFGMGPRPGFGGRPPFYGR